MHKFKEIFSMKYGHEPSSRLTFHEWHWHEKFIEIDNMLRKKGAGWISTIQKDTEFAGLNI